jgi:hypothetical protein
MHLCYEIGAEMAHHLLVNLMFRYNINAQVRRLDAHNNGHQLGPFEVNMSLIPLYFFRN